MASPCVLASTPSHMRTSSTIVDTPFALLERHNAVILLAIALSRIDQKIGQGEGGCIVAFESPSSLHY